MADPIEALFVPAVTAVAFTVVGVAKSGGSKRAFRHPSTGRIILTEQVNNKAWRQEVAGAAQREMDGRELMLGPLAVSFVFFRPRPKGHYGSGRNAAVVKPSAPAFPVTKPDVLKLARAVEDSLTGIVYRDDAQIVQESLAKRWGLPERCEITVTAL